MTLKPSPIGNESATSSSKSATAPAYKPAAFLLRTVVQDDSPGAISRLCVLAEAMLGFANKTIGRQNPMYNGQKVYTKLSDYFHRQVDGHAFSEVIGAVRNKLLSNPREHLKKLIKIEGKTTSDDGETNTVDCDYAMTLVKPIFTLICGEQQAYTDCGLPSAMKALFTALDRDLVKAMLRWREGQKLFRKQGLKKKIEALRNDNGKLDEKKVHDLLKPYGWIAEFYIPLQHSLRNAQPIDFHYIDECRANLFAGIIFNRCISPCLMSDEAERKKLSDEAKTVLTKTAAAINKIFVQRYKKFVRSFVMYADSCLPEAEADELRILERSHERIEKIGKGRTVDDVANQKIVSRKGHSSAPQLLQGKDFLAAMDKEASAATKDKLDGELARKADNRAAERQWIDDFRKKHQDAFRKNPELEWSFSTGLRKWRQTREQLPEAAFKEKLARLYRRAERRIAEPAATSPPVIQQAMQTADDADRVSSPRIKTTGNDDRKDKRAHRHRKTSQLSMHVNTLTDEQSDVLRQFLKMPRRRDFIERFPALEAKLKTAYIAWLNEGADGNPTLALTKIFEALSLRQFFDAMALRGRTSESDFQKLQNVCAEWLKVAGRDRPGPEELARLWHENIANTPAPTYRPGIQVRVAEAFIDELLMKPVVREEMANDTLRKTLLEMVKPWLNAGAPGTNPERIVMEFYESALLTHFIHLQPNGTLAGTDVVRLRDAMRKQVEQHPGQPLGIDFLWTLLGQQHDTKPGQQS